VTAAEVAAMLTCGTLRVDACRELSDPAFAADVDRRLAGVGLERATGAGRWIARRIAEPPDRGGWEPFHRLQQPHLAVIAAVYLHLQYLPRQAGVDPDPQATLALDELCATFASYGRQTMRRFVSELRRSGHLSGEGDDIAAGPLLAAIDPVTADARADQAVRSYLVRRQMREHFEEEPGHSQG
jgi:hypothetical protein